MKFRQELIWLAVLLLSVASVSARPGSAQGGWQPEVQALQAKIEILEASNAALHAQVEDLGSAVAGLTAQLGELSDQFSDHADDPNAHHAPTDVGDLDEDVSDLQDLLQHVSRDGDDLFLTGANLHVVSGIGSTRGNNGLGNIIIGYNESRESGSAVPGDTSRPARSLETGFAAGRNAYTTVRDSEQTAQFGVRTGAEFESAIAGSGDIRTGSHNLILGHGNNYSTYGGIVSGEFNTISGEWSCAIGGRSNEANESLAVVVGGVQNKAQAAISTIVGGEKNIASGFLGTVSGGTTNEAAFDAASVFGGSGNVADGLLSSVCGGRMNQASGSYSGVAGGENNVATGEASLVSEGCGRTVDACGGP